MIITCLVSFVVWLTSSTFAAETRLEQVERLRAEFDKASETYYQRDHPQFVTTEEKIAAYQAWPGWEYLPKFLELAQADPTDAAALECCEWIFERCGNVGNQEQPIFAADELAWQIVAKHHSRGEHLPMLCFEAVAYPAPAREKFLRGLLEREDLTRAERGFGTLALGEFLAQRCATLEAGGIESWGEPEDDFQKHLRDAIAPEWLQYSSAKDPQPIREESIRLMREVLEKYADVRVEITAPHFRNLHALGEKASKTLHALERLVVGKEAPAIAGVDLAGEPLELASFRGKVVLLSFWFTGCGPCMAMVPEEQAIMNEFANEPFVLLGVCGDSEVEQGRQTAQEHGMTWQHWFDGKEGPIVRDYNIQSWPTFYLLDREGRIVKKNLAGRALREAVAAALVVDP